jgi:heme exporter protein A
MLSTNSINYNNLRDISFTIFHGACFILNGDNSDIKNFLYIISGINKKYQKNITWNDISIHKFYNEYSSDINFICDEIRLDKYLSVKQNIYFLSSLSDSKVALDSAIRYFDLDNILNKKIKELNQEELIRVKLSQLIFSPKTIWLLEDPDKNLSQKYIEKLFNLVSSRIKDGGIVIMTLKNDSKNDIFCKLGKKIDLNDWKI